MFFTEEKAKRYIKDIGKYVYQEKLPIPTFRCLEVRPEDPSYAGVDVDDSSWDNIPVGSLWGARDRTMWFRAVVEIPESWKEEKVALDLDLSGAEALVYVNGHPVQAIDRRHREIVLNDELKGQGKLQIALKAWNGLGQMPRFLVTADLVRINPVAEDFYYRANTMLEAILVMEEHDFDRQSMMTMLNDALNATDLRKPGSEGFYNSIRAANHGLIEALQVYKPKQENRPIITAIGHSHIDVAWLWRLCHTREKCSRTFSTVLNLMDQYEDYHFLQSQPQLYEYIQEDYPEIYEKIKAKVAAGLWEVTGGMWVEADCNVPSGESLVRQFLFGNRFMEQEFGVQPKILWLPDVFGYSWALPQIIKQSGLDYFMTTKISWSQYNRPTYDTFKWRGIDGTEVLTHFITTTDTDEPRYYTYNGNLTPASAVKSWKHYQQKNINDELLISFGWGDGGGGPTKEMLQAGLKMQELPGIPEMRFGKAGEYFERLGERVGDHPQLPVVDGELYLEYHRGTYTSQGKTKRNNRKLEGLLHDLEFYNSLGAQLLALPYHQTEISNLWKILLRNQFHDILPGSSIREVYEDSELEMGEALATGQGLLEGTLLDIAKNVEVEGLKLVVFNSLPWTRSEAVEVPWTEELASYHFITNEQEVVIPKKVTNGTEVMARLVVKNVPAHGYTTLQAVERGSKSNPEELRATSSISVTTEAIETPFYQIKLNGKGQIISLFDKEANREVVPVGKAINVLQAFEDRPMAFDAWDIDIYYTEKEYEIDQLVEATVEEQGGDRGVLKFVWKFEDSTIEQRMIVYSERRQIDFATNVDWQERQILLKAAFPVDIRSTKATYEIQFGNVERPTHWNTSWDYARFETVAQRWVDLSERSYGVSLLNDCKYGHDIKDNVMRITLLKSAIDPDPIADQGLQEFVYSVYPHQGDWFEGDTTRLAMDLNHPLVAVFANSPAGEIAATNSLVRVSSTSVILDTIKKSEDDDSLVLRFYEYGNRRDTVAVELGWALSSVEACDLMERSLETHEYQGTTFSFAMTPYEIKTFKVRLEGAKSGWLSM